MKHSLRRSYKIFVNQADFLWHLKHNSYICWKNISTHNGKDSFDFKNDGYYLVRAEVFAKGGLYDELIS